MNKYKQSTDPTAYDLEGAETGEYAGTDFIGRRKPILNQRVTSEPAPAISAPELTTADIAQKSPKGVTSPAPAVVEPNLRDETSGPLFSPDEAKDYHARWDAIQVGFVDEPRHSVEQADTLVASTIKRLAEIFADERKRLDEQWSRGESVSTEDLRLALQRYRSFFGRLLSV